MAAAAKISAVKRTEGVVPKWLDGVFEALPDAVHAATEAAQKVIREFREAKEDEAMSRAVIFGRAGETTPLEVRTVLGEQRRQREERGDAEEGWVNAHEDHLWPVEQENTDVDNGWLDTKADQP